MEEQNLFVDEVREANRWSALFESLEWNNEGSEREGEILSKLDGWICEGLDQLRLLVRQEDGPLGWASNPRVFAVGTYILRGAVTMNKSCGSPRLRKGVEDIKELLREPSRHRVSRLLMEPLEEA